MEKITRLFLLLIMVVIGIYFFLPQKPYIGRSNIHGQGLFAGKNYKKREVIFENLFPYKDNSIMLFNPIKRTAFDSYILNEGHYINHCSLNKNIDVLSDDYRVFRVIAKTNIKKHDELFADYNLVHKHFPFIASARPNYLAC
jgi:hypothetical protein